MVSEITEKTAAKPSTSQGIPFVGSAGQLLGKLLAGIGLTLSGPLYGAIVAAIRLTSRGPALFRQERVGQDGRSITVLKFRSMIVNAEAETGRRSA